MNTKILAKEKQFIENILHNSGVEYQREFKFCNTRRFRADFAVPSLRLLIEYEGLWFPNSKHGSGRSRHTSVVGYTKDTEKYNIATLGGWRVLRYTVMSYKQFFEDFNTLRHAQ